MRSLRCQRAGRAAERRGAFNLTAWGFQDCARDAHNGSMGGMLSRLLLRTLPDHYTDRSIYAHFPFMTPTAMGEVLTRLRLRAQYDFARPEPRRALKVVDTARGSRAVLLDRRSFATPCASSMRELTRGYGMFLAWDDTLKHRRDWHLVRRARCAGALCAD